MLRRPLCALASGFVLAAVLAAPSFANAATIPGRYIVVLKDSVSDPGAVAGQHAREDGAVVSNVYRHGMKGYAAAILAEHLGTVRSDPRVQFVSQDQEMYGVATQNLSRAVDRIDGELSSARSGDGSGSVDINVAVIDSGIDRTNPDLNVAGGTSCINGSNNDPFDDQAHHGTAVAGLLGALDNNIGLVGVAPGARLWSFRVLKSNNGGTTSQILCGIDAVTASRFDSDPTNDIAVANISIIGPGSDDGNCGNDNKDPIHKAICGSVAAGVTIVAAAGNDGADISGHIPASYGEVLTATSMTDFDGQPGALGNASPGAVTSCPDSVSDDTASVFSSFASLPRDQAHTLAAPGKCDVSTLPLAACATKKVPAPSECYGSFTGTSFASPLIAGTVALCIASGPCAGLTPPMITHKIVADTGTYNQANPGYGFRGDPLHSPDPAKYYGYLIRAGLY